MMTVPRCPYCGAPDALTALWPEIERAGRTAWLDRHLATLNAEIDAALRVFPWPLRLLARVLIR